MSRLPTFVGSSVVALKLQKLLSSIRFHDMLQSDVATIQPLSSLPDYKDAEESSLIGPKGLNL